MPELRSPCAEDCVHPDHHHSSLSGSSPAEVTVDADPPYDGWTRANPSLLKAWAESADHPALSPEEKELRLKGESYIINCLVDLGPLDSKGFPKTFVMARQCEGVVMIGMNAMAIIDLWRFELMKSALEYLASEEAAFKGGTACSEYAQEVLDKLAKPEEQP